ncbi:CRISPR-associated endonuclease Cas3'' [Haloactinospora alba]|uniref:CRISPR-associated endonuclease Cas3'' n=1 Tax=Haloactinospora alba TaxID=405555 RepID=UPI00319E72FC
MTSSGGSFLSTDDLSDAARQVWAKHNQDDKAWLPLRRHMADSAAVAGRLWDTWLPSQVRELISTALPGGAADARKLAVWISAVHDCGKATPAFACQVDGLADKMRREGLTMPTGRQLGEDRKLAPHGLAGHVLLRDWLVERHGWRVPDTHQLTAIVGGHHGVPPSNSAIKDLADHPELLRARGSETVWSQVQNELLDWTANECEVLDRLPQWAKVKLPQPAQVLLSALVIVSDWIASSRDYFPYTADASPTDPDRLDNAWAALKLPRPWQPVLPQESVPDLFASRFDLPSDATVRPVQEETVRAAREMRAPGMVIVEAPMGEGKPRPLSRRSRSSPHAPARAGVSSRYRPWLPETRCSGG